MAKIYFLVGAFITGLIFTIFVDLQTEDKLQEQLSKGLGQSLEYKEMKAKFFNDKIIIKDAVLFDETKQASSFNATASDLILNVDYNNAILKRFEVNSIEAHEVTLNFSYSGIGESNFHQMQIRLRDYIQQRKAENKPTIQWNVYNMVLNNVTVLLDDYQLGNVGTFHFDKIVLPHISSQYQSQNNKDIVFRAVTKEIVNQFVDGKIEGQYDKGLLTQFVIREGKAEALTLFELSKSKIGNKFQHLMADFMQKMNKQ
jgi:hypothetical protein